VSAFATHTERVSRTPREIARAGMFLGVLAFFFTLPPLKTHHAWVPLMLGLLAAACGVWAISRGAGRIGWGAIALGIIGLGLGLLATRSSDTNLEQVVVWGTLIGSTLAWATPLAYAAVGGMIAERSGVTNIALEGMMLAGAFFACLGSDKFNSWGMGLLIAAIAGAGFALLHAFFSIHLRADQIVGGTAINFLALGVTGYFFIQIYGENGTPGNLPRIPNVPLADWLGFSKNSFFGNAIGNLNLMIWLSFLLLVVAWVVLFRTPVGLRLRSVGEHPRAADTVGISVYKTRYVAVVISGILASLGGAYLAIGFLGSFNEGMTNGRGFIALAAVIFGNWRPFGAYAAAILFGASTALSFRLATYSDSAAVLFQALPYVLTLIAVAGVIGRSIPPAAVGRPYVKQ
jgi:ABC-type uncharacterized transport system permease subunit